MTLRTKVIAILLGLFAAYAVVEVAVQRLVLLPSFVALERENATRNVERVIEALRRDAELLIPSVLDWGNWDDTYAFAVDGNAEYIEANLSAKAMETLGVNLLAFYDTNGKRVWGLAYDHEAGAEMALGELSEGALRQPHPLLGEPGSEDTIVGLYRTGAGLFLMASGPILTSAIKGPSRGRVLMGRRLDAAAIARLGEQARVQLSVQPLEPGTAAASGAARVEGKEGKENKEATEGTLRSTSISLEETEQVTHASTTVLDVAGQPVLRLQVDTPRSIVAQGQTTLRYATLSLGLAGGLVLLLLLATLRRSVLNPLSRLTRHATAVGTQGDLDARLDLDRKDELGVLANELNTMVERLAETRQRLLDQSFKSGVAEMASGVLHNIGNAITPLGVKLTTLRRDLQQAPLAEIDLASAELADPATTPDRRAALDQFVELAARELADIVRKTLEEIDTVRGQVDHVQLILADQQRFSRAERVIEPLALHRVVEESVRLLPEPLRRFATLEIDPELAQVGRVRAARVALQQVIGNLLINAAESVRESGQQADTGRIRVHCIQDPTGAPGQVHLCFEDNGIGIATENLARLFERGFSTKARGSGMGLHWSANTASALGGRLYAESAGPGRGACLHLLLPLADTATQPLEHA
jgi:two-component system NtrC family sensor kinase